MKVIITAGELNELYLWSDFCDIRGINPWAMKEGLMDRSEEFTLTPEELIRFGVAAFAALERRGKE